MHKEIQHLLSWRFITNVKHGYFSRESRQRVPKRYDNSTAP